MLNEILERRRAGLVQRLHTEGNIKPQSIAEHSWGVAYLCWRFHPDPTVTLLMAALMHDVPEYYTGDIPATAKWRFNELRVASLEAEARVSSDKGIINPRLALSEESQDFLNLCDSLDLGLYCLEQYFTGNAYAAEVGLRVREKFTKRLCNSKGFTGANKSLYPIIRDFVDAWERKNHTKREMQGDEFL